MARGRLQMRKTATMMKSSLLWNQFYKQNLNLESILPNTFLHKTKIFFCFLLLSLSVCSMRKYCLYFEMAKLKSKNWKIEEFSLVGLTPVPKITTDARNINETAYIAF